MQFLREKFRFKREQQQLPHDCTRRHNTFRAGHSLNDTANGQLDFYGCNVYVFTNVRTQNGFGISVFFDQVNESFPF